ncbi:hypothetical protein [Odoribacter lunatus]|uniref:hypothetical protein n=1 Tax=Odoribacter lunatus TaxID=2941335 RepID=UPI0020400F5E|nr:hypothetical protein [Odoribacter lunatus]
MRKTVKIDNDKLIRFFKNEATDSAGRTLKDILLFNDDEIEYCHNFIQWIFPTQMKSQHNNDAPIIDSDFKKLFQ